MANILNLNYIEGKPERKLLEDQIKSIIDYLAIKNKIFLSYGVSKDDSDLILPNFNLTNCNSVSVNSYMDYIYPRLENIKDDETYVKIRSEYNNCYKTFIEMYKYLKLSGVLKQDLLKITPRGLIKYI